MEVVFDIEAAGQWSVVIVMEVTGSIVIIKEVVSYNHRGG